MGTAWESASCGGLQRGSAVFAPLETVNSDFGRSQEVPMHAMRRGNWKVNRVGDVSIVVYL